MRLASRVVIVGVYVVVFWLVLPAALWALARRVDHALGWALAPSWVGALPAAVGAWFLFGGIAVLWTRGEGLPVSALPPPKLTVTGPYRVVRHPIYFGFNLVVLGAGLVLGSRALWAIVAPGFLPVWVVYALVEERGLARRFGDDWARYKRDVGLLPRWPSRA